MPGAEKEDSSQQQIALPRDPRRLFGDLPNSSYDADSLGDPIERELQQRAALLDAADTMKMTLNIGPKSSTATREQQSTETTRYNANTTDSCDIAGGDEAFWREECRRLKNKLALLKTERERLAVARASLPREGATAPNHPPTPWVHAASNTAELSTLLTTGISPRQTTSQQETYRTGHSDKDEELSEALRNRLAYHNTEDKILSLGGSVRDNLLRLRDWLGPHSGEIVSTSRYRQDLDNWEKAAEVPYPVDQQQESNNSVVTHSNRRQPGTTPAMCGPQLSSLGRKMQMVAVNPPSLNSRMSGRSQKGWSRVAVSDSDGRSGSNAERGWKVWEWNGRTVIVGTSPRRRPGRTDHAVEKAEEVMSDGASGDGWDKPASVKIDSVVTEQTTRPKIAPSMDNSSLLNEMKEVKAAVQSLAQTMSATPCSLAPTAASSAWVEGTISRSYFHQPSNTNYPSSRPPPLSEASRPHEVSSLSPSRVAINSTDIFDVTNSPISLQGDHLQLHPSILAGSFTSAASTSQSSETAENIEYVASGKSKVELDVDQGRKQVDAVGLEATRDLVRDATDRLQRRASSHVRHNDNPRVYPDDVDNIVNDREQQTTMEYEPLERDRQQAGQVVDTNVQAHAAQKVAQEGLHANVSIEHQAPPNEKGDVEQAPGTPGRFPSVICGNNNSDGSDNGIDNTVNPPKEVGQQRLSSGDDHVPNSGNILALVDKNMPAGQITEKPVVRELQNPDELSSRISPAVETNS